MAEDHKGQHSEILNDAILARSFVDHIVISAIQTPTKEQEMAIRSNLLFVIGLLAAISAAPNCNSEVLASAQSETQAQNYLWDNFGIPKRLSDCEHAHHPITAEMTEPDRRLSQLLNDYERTACRNNWQEHQADLKDEKALSDQQNLQAKLTINIKEHPLHTDDFTINHLMHLGLEKGKKSTNPDNIPRQSASTLEIADSRDPDQTALSAYLKRHGDLIDMVNDEITKRREQQNRKISHSSNFNLWAMISLGYTLILSAGTIAFLKYRTRKSS